MKPIAFLRGYVQILIFGVWITMKRFLSNLWNLWNFISLGDRFLVIFIIFSVPFLITGWRSYTIAFDNDYVYFHKILTGDLVPFIAFKGIIFLAILIFHFFDEYKRLSKRLKYLSVAGLVLFYALSYFYPERISPNQETKFTWQFYAYGFFLSLIVISSFLGMNHTQKA